MGRHTTLKIYGSYGVAIAHLFQGPAGRVPLHAIAAAANTFDNSTSCLLGVAIVMVHSRPSD